MKSECNSSSPQGIAQYRIADDNPLLVSGRKILVLVDDETGTRQGFYQSKGKCGGAAAGQWVPFYGFEFVPEVGGCYYIKHPHGKTFPEDTEMGRMSAWLGQQEVLVAPSGVLEVPVWFRTDLQGKSEMLRNLVQLNAYLDALGAPSREDAPRFGVAEEKIIRQALNLTG